MNGFEGCICNHVFYRYMAKLVKITPFVSCNVLNALLDYITVLLFSNFGTHALYSYMNTCIKYRYVCHAYTSQVSVTNNILYSKKVWRKPTIAKLTKKTLANEA